jgi:hypothetical protein
MAGSTQTYTAMTFDQYDNSLDDVTGSTIFAILPPNDGGSWLANVYTSKKVGTWTVTGIYSGLPASPDTALLTVTNTAPDYIVITPDSSTITAGQNATYTVEAFDLGDNSLGDVTAGTDFDILEPGDGGSWVANVYTSAKAGTWTITGNNTSLGLTDTAALTVNLGPAHHVIISPAASTIAAGNTETYTVEAFDIGENSLSDVTADTDFTIVEPGDGGSWSGDDDNVYTSAVSGTWTVRGTYSGLPASPDTAALTVTLGTASSIVISPDGRFITAGSTQAFTATAYDQFDNSLVVTLDTGFTIVEPGHGGFWVANVYYSAVPGIWTVIGDYGVLTDTAQLIVTT